MREITNDLARRELERKLQSMADRYAMRLHIEHNEDWHGWRAVPALEYRRHQPGTAIYHGLVGDFEFVGTRTASAFAMELRMCFSSSKRR